MRGENNAPDSAFVQTVTMYCGDVSEMSVIPLQRLMDGDGRFGRIGVLDVVKAEGEGANHRDQKEWVRALNGCLHVICTRSRTSGR